MEKSMTYEQALHAVQTGVKMMIGLGDNESTEPKHLRVGINSAMCDSSGLALLLIEKKIFTVEEYTKAITDEMVREAKRYENRLSKKLGRVVHLL